MNVRMSLYVSQEKSNLSTDENSRTLDMCVGSLSSFVAGAGITSTPTALSGE